MDFLDHVGDIGEELHLKIVRCLFISYETEGGRQNNEKIDD